MPRIPSPALRHHALAAAALALLSATAQAQEAAAAPDKSDGLKLDAVVVTGTSTAKSKMRTSVAISTIESEGVTAVTAASATDVLRAVPGIRAEASGGESNANVAVRGIPVEAGLAADPALELPAAFEPGVATGVVRDFCAARQDFDAVVCCSDVLALLTIQALRAFGRSVPQDVAVVGYDDMPLAAYCDPPLTTVHQPVAEAGAQLVEALLGQLRGERAGPRTMPVYLKLRQSAPQAGA